MRARLSWLALIPLFVLSGCGTVSDRSTANAPSLTLSLAESNLGEALAHYSQALISESTLGSFEESLRQTRLAAELDPSDLPLALKAAAGHLARKENAQAVKALERTLPFHPESPELGLLLGIAYQLTGAPEKATRLYRNAIRLRPGHPDGYRRLAALQLGEGRERDAIATLEAGLKAADDGTALIEFLENLGRIHIGNGEVKEALRCFEPVARKMPDDLAIQELLGRCYAEIGETGKALSTLTAVLKEQPRNANTALAIGEIYEAANDLPRAEEYYTRATRGDTPDASPYVRLCTLLLESDPARAAASAEEGVKLFPHDLSLRAVLGLIYVQQRRFEDAVAEYAAIEQDAAAGGATPKLRPAFYFWYGSACEQAGQFDRAERLLETCVQMDPTLNQALNYLAYMWAEKGVKLDRALNYVTQALQARPKDAAYLDTLGWIRFKQGNYEAALKDLRKASDLMPDDATVAEHVGDAWHALKDERKAVEYWKRGLRVEPANPSLRGKLHLPPPDSTQSKPSTAAPSTPLRASPPPAP